MKRLKLFTLLVIISGILLGCDEETVYRSEIYRKNGENSYTKWDIPAIPVREGAFVCWQEQENKKCISGELTIITYPVK